MSLNYYELMETPKDSLEITNTNITDVTNYAKAQVVDANLTAANIKKDVSILGITGTYQEIDKVSSVPSTKSTNIIYNSTDSSYYLWEYPPYLCFTANTAGSTVGMTISGEPDVNFEYSTDKENWTTFTPDSTIVTLANINDKVYFRGDNPNGLSYDHGGIEEYSCTFTMTGSIAASGSIMSLIDKTCQLLTLENCNNGCLMGLFNNCTSLTSAPELPATTLAENCYSYMFNECTSLITVPELPATILTGGCYSKMFSGCIDLTVAPELPATELGSDCYSSMFAGCTALTTAPSLPATGVKYRSYRNMFNGCTALIVSDTSGTGYDKAWTIPANAACTSVGMQALNFMFADCAGTRSTDTPDLSVGSQITYYTQNTPV